SQDTVGLFARSAVDVSYAFSALVGAVRAERRITGGFEGALDRARCRPFTIGVPRSGFFGYSPKADAVFEEALGAVRAAGIAIVDEVDAKTGSDFAISEVDELVVLIWEMHHDLGAYLAKRGVPGASSIEEIVAFNAAHPRTELEYFGQEHLEAAVSLEGYSEAEYRRARNEIQRRAEGAIARSKTLGEVDVLCVPTMGPAWTIDHVNGDFVSGAGYSVAAVAGAPSISVPIGDVSGLPVGMTVFSHAYADAQVLAVAEKISEILAVRLTPRFLPRIDA
ncbi:MAG: amidase family protein, partial [Actinomycetota bacterium]|nr:amidase family protein [Actinomycetota bacterium]